VSKLIYKADSGYSIELDISSSMRRAIHDSNPDHLDKDLVEMKRLIAKNTSGLNNDSLFKMPALPKFIRRFF
jgi:hypothetical protein